MATDTTPEADEIEAAPVKVGEKSSSGMLKWIAIIAVLMIAEGAGLFLFLSPSGPSEADAEQKAAEDIADGLHEIEADSDLVEVEMSPAFNVTNSSADLGTLVHINFEIVAGVSTRNADAFATAANETYKNRLRQVVNEIIRSASLEELQDPDLNQLKRRVREDLNKALQQSYVVEIVIPKMVVHVQ